jgi:predicted glycogen debranching enzyme
MSTPLRRVAYRKSAQVQPEQLAAKEWIVTNGLGGYASGTLAGVITRGFHGYLIAALPTPLGRVMMLNDLMEKIQIADGPSVQLSGEERLNAPLKAHGWEYLQEFFLEDGNPVWVFQFGEAKLEKRVQMVHRQNTVHISYRLKGPGSFKFSSP